MMLNPGLPTTTAPFPQSTAALSTTNGLLFIDPTVENYQQLLVGLQPNITTIVLDSAQDGIQQITTALQGQSGLTSLHILSHGFEGGLQLGSSLITASNLEQYGSQLQAWQNALTADADILFYGCNVVASDSGDSLLSNFAALTGADIAASDDLTGTAGDWVLEVQTGQIESGLAFDSSTLVGYDRSLNVIVNEWSNLQQTLGITVAFQWVELLVTADSDLRGWTLADDGVTYTTFQNTPFWQNVQAGTLITLYNGGSVLGVPLRDPSIPPDDTSLSDGNYRVIAAHNNTNLFTAGTWNGLASNTSDNPIVRNNAATVIHDWDQGNTAAFTASPPQAGANQATVYTGNTVGGVATASNYSTINLATTAATPGQPNGGANTIWINGLRAPVVNNTDLRLIGEATFGAGTTVGGTTVGGLSGISYDSATNTYYVVADDRTNARFYTMTIADLATLGTLGAVSFAGVTTLKDAGGTAYTAGTSDTEGIAFTSNGTVFISSEGILDSGTPPYVNPFVREFNLANGNQVNDLTLSAKFIPTGALSEPFPYSLLPAPFPITPTSGIRKNLSLESLTRSPSGNALFAAVEGSLAQDATTADLVNGISRNRILRFNRAGGVYTTGAEYFYQPDGLMGLVELLAIDDNTLLALERGNLSEPHTSRLYQVSLAGATDVSGVASLSASTPIAKTLVAELSTTLFPGISSIGNFEGMTLGPILPNGKRSLILVSDNAFFGNSDLVVFEYDIPTISLAAGVPPVENTPTNGTFNLTLSEAAASPITVNFNLAGTATGSGTDYTLVAGTGVTAVDTVAGSFTIAAGATTAALTVQMVNDIAAEAAETIALTLTGASGGYTLGTTAATLTIAANDTTVTTTNDAGEGSLRQAVLNANAFAGDDIINFVLPAGAQTISLLTTLPSLTDNVQILNTTGANNLAIRANTTGAFDIFTVNSGVTASFDQLTISNGNLGIVNNGTITSLNNSTISNNQLDGIFNVGAITILSNNTISGNQGRGIVNDFTGNGTIATLSNSTISGNQIDGIVNSGIITTLNNSTISGNQGRGILNAGAGTIATLSNSTISGNQIEGIFNGGTITTLSNSTLSGNQVDGIFNFGTIATLSNSTVSGNQVDGIFNDVSGTIGTINNVTIATNTGNGIDNGGAITTLSNSILAGNTAGNLGGVNAPTNTNNNLNVATLGDAGLGALANNGGPTQTHALLAGSAAINAAGAGATTTDQRGIAAVGTRDIGAFELGNNPPTLATATLNGTNGDITVSEGTTVTLQATATDPEADTLTFTLDGANGGTIAGAAGSTRTSNPINRTYTDEGTATLTFTVSDGSAAPVNVSRTVTITNVAPTITQGATTTVIMTEDSTPTPFALTLNATDPGTTDMLTWSILTPATRGTASVSATPTGNTQAISYLPNANVNGNDSFVVQVNDGDGGTAQITVNVTVNPVNDAPSFTNASNQTLAPGTNTVQAVANWANTFIFGPADEAGQAVDAVVVTVTNDPSNIFTTAPTVTPNGTLTYTPNGNAGTATIAVQLRDNGGTDNGGVNLSPVATFTITVASPAPVLNLATGITPVENTPTNGTFTLNLNQAPATDLTVNFTLAGTATSGNDYTLVAGAGVTAVNLAAGTFTIAAGATSATLTVQMVNDIAAEADETIALTLTSVSGGYTLGTAATTLTIAANDTIVTNTNNSGEGSLRQAITNANALAGTDTIAFALPTGPQTITLATVLPNLSDNFNLSNTTGASNLTIQQANLGLFNIFRIDSGVTASFDQVTVSTGRFGIFNASGATTSLTNSRIVGNLTGIVNEGTIVSLNNSTIAGNQGPGLVNSGTITSLANSTIAGNQADGIFNEGTIVNLSNSTISGNQLNGILNRSGNGTIGTINNTTIAANVGNGLSNETGRTITTLSNSILVGNGTNLNNLGTIVNSTNSLTGTFAALGIDSALADNGGSTQTHALLPGSAAIDAAGPGATTTDQRGNAAVGTRDIGAFELATVILTPALPYGITHLQDQGSVDGVYQIGGIPGEQVLLQFDWAIRDAAFNNEIGFFLVDDAQGTLNGLAPTDPNYARTALTSAGRQILFRSGEGAGAGVDISVTAGQFLVFYLVQDTTTENWLNTNPSNSASGRQVLFSRNIANLNQFDQGRDRSLAPGALEIAWEDLAGGGDQDFNDVVIRITPGAYQVPGTTGNIPVNFTIAPSNASFANELGFFYVDDASGRIGNLRPGNPGYTNAAFASGNFQVLLASGQRQGASSSPALPAGRFVGWYLIQNASTTDFLLRNLANRVDGNPVAFFSFAAANPDGVDHFRRISATEFGFEDLTGGGDRDFDDLVFRVSA